MDSHFINNFLYLVFFTSLLISFVCILGITFYLFLICFSTMREDCNRLQSTDYSINERDLNSVLC